MEASTTRKRCANVLVAESTHGCAKQFPTVEHPCVRGPGDDGIELGSPEREGAPDP